MHDIQLEQALATALDAYRPSARILDEMRRRICVPRQGVSIVSISQNSEKILKSVFKRVDKQMQKIA